MGPFLRNEIQRSGKVIWWSTGSNTKQVQQNRPGRSPSARCLPVPTLHCNDEKLTPDCPHFSSVWLYEVTEGLEQLQQ